jgi:hypothetical protein
MHLGRFSDPVNGWPEATKFDGPAGGGWQARHTEGDYGEEEALHPDACWGNRRPFADLIVPGGAAA